jgi:uncharacterized protein
MYEVLSAELEGACSLGDVDLIHKKYSEGGSERDQTLKVQSAFENLAAVEIANHVRACCRGDCMLASEHKSDLPDTLTVLAAWILSDPDYREVAKRVLRRGSRDMCHMKPHQWLSLRREGKATSEFFQIEASSVVELIVALHQAITSRSLSLSAAIPTHSCLDVLIRGIRECIISFILPSVRREWVVELNRKSEMHALENFRANLRNKLLQPGIHVPGVVMGIDPGLASGSKVVIMTSCRCMDTFKFNACKVSSKIDIDTFQRYYAQHKPELIVVGDGTGSLETRKFIANLHPEVDMCVISETGASHYSISERSMQELGNLAVEYRGCVSLVRRALDPLAELSKIEPQHLSVGMYQHDLGQKQLKMFLHEVVRECVACVGADINQTSEDILALVPGLDAHKAHAIMYYKSQVIGRDFRNRAELLEVPGIDHQSWTEAIGFIRVSKSDLSPLDATAVHPEMYMIANEVVRHHPEWAHLYSYRIPSPAWPVTQSDEADVLRLLTLSDPRDSIDPIAVKPAKEWVKQTITPGSQTYGTIQTVTSFGAFVSLRNLGISSDGLLHVSKYPIGVVDPHYYKANQEVLVQIESVEVVNGKKRISLTTRFS